MAVTPPRSGAPATVVRDPRPDDRGGTVLRGAVIGAVVGGVLTGVLAAGLHDGANSFWRDPGTRRLIGGGLVVGGFTGLAISARIAR